MPGYSAVGGPDPEVRQAIRKWRDGLVNLTGTNRLLNLKPSKTGMLAIAQPAPGRVLTAVLAGRGYAFRALRPDPEKGEPAEDEDAVLSDTGPGAPRLSSPDHLDVDKPAGDLGRSLRNLYRRSSQAYLDQGLSILYLAFGMLEWSDVDRTEYRSPVLLVPVRLETAGPGVWPILAPTDDDVLVNPALALKLDQQFGIALPAAENLPETEDEPDLSTFLDQVRDAIGGRGGWRVTDDLILSYFSFAKEAMYRDLLDNEHLIVAHDGVRALALGGTATGLRENIHERFAFDEIRDRQIDELAPPETTPLILDADSSQRACIAAALAGKSFVMDGPPGTGKSQTIANIIGVLLHAGKSVLFVSEKAAALDVVRDRLAGKGLDHFLLELHSAKATRKQVADELGRTLLTEPVPPAELGGLDRQRARTRRQQLNEYADAMNRRRDPLGMSLHEVLGRIALLNHVPAAPLPALPGAELTVERYADVREQAKGLADAWRPARQGASFAWRGVTERGSLNALLTQVHQALATLSGTHMLNGPLAEATGLRRPSHAPALAAVLDHVAARPVTVPADWLTAERLTPAQESISALAVMLSAIAAAQDAAARAAGTSWQAIPLPDTLPELPDLTGVFPPAPDVSGMQAEQVVALADAFDAGADMLASRTASLGSLAAMLGLQPPDSFASADDVLAVARLAEAPYPPERSWLTPAGHASALSAADALRSAASALAAAEAAALAYFTPHALHEDAAGLASRLASHHGLGKMGGEYRQDKKTLAAFTAPGVSSDAARQRLGLVVAWQQAAAAFAQAEQAHARALGRYYAGRATDFGAVGGALGVAETALRLVRGQDTARVADYLAGDRQASLADLAAGIARDLRTWWESGAAPRELGGGAVTDAIAWLRDQRDLLRAVADRTGTVAAAVGQPVTAAQAAELVKLRAAADDAHGRLAARQADFDDAFGPLHDGPETDLTAVRDAFAWAARLRELVAGSAAAPLSEAQAKAVSLARSTPGLENAAAAWRSARDSLLAAFDADRRGSLAADLDDYADADELIRTLRQDTAGQDEWHAYQRARTSLAAFGLAEVVAYCVGQRVPGEHVAEVIERALLQGWAEQVLRSDPVLSASRARERDALVAEYRQLDAALIETASGEIIRACNSRRPRPDVGEPGIIAREAQRKRKHMPVRTLLELTRNAALAIKPCFMMSPLTVSQFLPANMRFDVVIFDEASQVLPGDAINCVYRGSSLILAGDQKQLPPTSWMFAGAGDDEEWTEDGDDAADFESILDLSKGAGVFRNLSLRWHRRSRHEALIAFSNFSFYDGKIITFPGAGGDGPDVGVEFFHVPGGIYRRGTSRDNLVEAAAVAERVIHHYRTRPHMSLGVVAFSESQAAAIDHAVTAARLQHPELEQYFNSDDRLRGFFVKNLETIQGDERDVLIFSVGYGRDEYGKLMMNFGPLNKPGGERRLNVAITRAHYRNEVVASIRAGDISESAGAAGVRHLRRYLDYAERGMAALALDAASDDDAESPFEESVIKVIRSWGYEVTPQVGTAGYRIDIGVRHPGQPGAYCLGVECDGYQYHSSRAARDRDRLREDVLRGLGWRLHRIWGTAWYRDRNGAEAALRAAIDKAAAAPLTGLLPGATVSSPQRQARPVMGTREAVFDATPSWAKPYTVASVPRLLPWVDPSEPGNGYYMADAIMTVVAAEGPLHIEVLRARLRGAWDIGHIGSKIRGNIDDAIAQAGVIRDRDFLLLSAGPVTVRTPVAACKRTVTQVHHTELTTALVEFVKDAAGISEGELSVRVARLYGWERRGPEITARLQERITALLDSGALTGTLASLTAPRAR